MEQEPEREPRRIREGYLVKKGSMFSSWKPMWVVLSEDGIEYFKKKTDSSPKGMIPLKGSSLTSPCQDFGKRMFVVKLATAKQQDHFFQASHLEERDAWVKDLKKAIQCIERGKRFSRKSTRKSIKLPSSINLGALYLSMKDPDKGIREMKLEKDKKIFNHCFTGSCVIDWLLSNNSIRNRQEGLVLASALMNEGYLQPAGDASKSAAEGLAETNFLDHEDAFYYFGHRRKNWKVRKFVLREDPAYIHYYDPAGGEEPLGAIHLRGCVVTAVEDNPNGKKNEVEGNLFEIITANEVHYLLQAATSAERTEWIKAIQLVARTGK
ncbi:pleckstrin isoform X2 [Heteronotia binoei]|uniref:pleckstrin isoform X2 n=1 Tax=Heteronotia binoei TaxID=13085 RepID=UPI00292D7BCD|nr:pleckstrin isoform X2 [Heteronotia binoei]